MKDQAIGQNDACAACALGKSRRDFLRESFVVAFGALLTLGATEKYG